MTSADRTGFDERRPDFLERVVTAIVVLGSAFFIFWQLSPDLIFSNSTPTGGDMGAHVWGPAFLRDELLPRFRLSGWTPDWYSGFPAFHFYMVIPALMIVILDVGLHPLLSIPIVLALGGAGAAAWVRGDNQLARRLLIAFVVVAPLIIGIPYNIAFKLVAVSGVVMFPVAAWALGQLGGLRFPGPAVLSLASLAFAFDRSFNIYGGNIASTLAGEFAASISLTMSLVALGLIIRGTRTGQYRGWAAICIALTGLCHLLPAFFLLASTLLLMVLRMAQRQWSAVSWLAVAGGISAFLSAFWVLPFFMRTAYLNDMGWERIEKLHSPLLTRSALNPSEVLSDYPPLPVLLVLAGVGLILSVKNRVEIGVLFALMAGLMAFGFVYFPDGRLWNARILPFYYLSVSLLAGVGVALLIKELLRTPAVLRAAIFVSSAILLVPTEIRDAWIWPEPVEGEAYWGPASGYAVRVLATVLIIAVVGLEIPRQLARGLKARWVIAVVLAAAFLVASPTRDVSSDSFSTIDGLFWAAVLLALLVLLLTALMRFVTRLLSKPSEPVWQAAPVPAAGLFPEVPPAIAEPPKRPRLGVSSARTAELAAPLVVASVLFVLLGLALNVLGGISKTEPIRTWSLAGFDIASDDNSFVTGWSRWNFSGLEAKSRSEGAIGDVGQGGWEEYQYVQRTMVGVGQEVGCGRAMWEFAPELNRYGTTMAMMLLPMWTDGCIGSLEGLYFEATPTVPYHFLIQTDLSAPSRTVGVSDSVGGPSQAMRDLPYGTFDINRGVERLRELGVRYYLAFSPQTIEAARNHPGLTEVTTASPWVVFETQAALVEPLATLPVVIDGVRDHQDEWLDVGVEWFGELDAVRPASSGPADWERVAASEIVERYEAEGTKKAGSIAADAESMVALLPAIPAAVTSVSNVVAETDRISFTVDEIGTPVLVRVSYFPSWKANGADGPFRVAPNFMVVVPTDTSVELVFSRTGVDWVSIAMTIAGLFALAVVWRLDRRSGARTAW